MEEVTVFAEQRDGISDTRLGGDGQQLLILRDNPVDAVKKLRYQIQLTRDAGLVEDSQL